MRILVSGTRAPNRSYDNTKILGALRRQQPSRIIHGAARGVDALVARWAHDSNIPAQSFPAAWYDHHPDWCRCKPKAGNIPRVCKAAGARRNQQMLDEAPPDLLLAFPAPKSSGTWDMIRRVIKAGIEVHIVPLEGE